MKQGLITEAQIDTSVTRLFLARFKLGMFDAPDHGASGRRFRSACSISRRTAQLALQAARESIVLLKNERQHAAAVERRSAPSP